MSEGMGYMKGKGAIEQPERIWENGRTLPEKISGWG
jgi:hypothetical protein